MGGEQSVDRVRAFSGGSVNKKQVISNRQQRMSRNNVFKMSGHMALGGQDNYPSNDFDNIKSSLKLLKNKQAQKKPEPASEPQNYYGGSYSSGSNQRQQPPPRKNVEPEYGSYDRQPVRQPARQQPSYNNQYQQMEQHYPSEMPKQKKYTQDYEKYEQPQPALKDRNRERNPNPRQPPSRQPIKQQSYQPSYQDDYRAPKDYRTPNDFEDKAIKEINRQNRVQIKEYNPSEFIECRMGCGRTFNPDSVKKHEANCKKVFQKKRKEFKAQDQRIIANEQVKLMKKGAVIEKKIEAKKAQEKMPKWKAESLQLRAGIKATRDDGYEPTNEEKRMLQIAKSNDSLKCHICGRTFNEQAGKRHIAFCEQQSKKNQMKRR